MAGHFTEGLKEQWQRVRAGFGGRAPPIGGMTALYRAELLELHSAEQQLCALADELWISVRNAALADRLSEYAAALRTREAELRGVLRGVGAENSDRPDEVMRALVDKASRLAEQTAENVRDAAIVASIQRIIHYMIAEHGTVAAHAKALGRLPEASHFAEQADVDKDVDRELSELATSTLNLEAMAGEKPDARRGH